MRTPPAGPLPSHRDRLTRSGRGASARRPEWSAPPDLLDAWQSPRIGGTDDGAGARQAASRTERHGRWLRRLVLAALGLMVALALPAAAAQAAKHDLDLVSRVSGATGPRATADRTCPRSRATTCTSARVGRRR